MNTRTKFFSTLTLAVGILAAVASIAGYFGERAWLLDLCSQFRLPYIYLFSALTFWYAVKRDAALTAAFGGALIINAMTAFGYSFPMANAIAATGTPLRVVQMNLWVRNHDYARLSRFMLDSRADVIGVEEYSDAADHAFQQMGVFQRYPYHLSLQTSDRNSQMALLSRLPLSNIRISESSALRDRTLFADITTGNHEATIVLMHPRPPVRQSLYDRACLQFKTTGSMRSKLQSRVIVIGDLNTTQFSWKFDKFTKDMNVVDTRREHGPSPTWLVWFPVLPIDFVLVSPDIAVRHFEVAPPTGSDHSPVIADLVI